MLWNFLFFLWKWRRSGPLNWDSWFISPEYRFGAAGQYQAGTEVYTTLQAEICSCSWDQINLFYHWHFTRVWNIFKIYKSEILWHVWLASWWTEFALVCIWTATLKNTVFFPCIHKLQMQFVNSAQKKIAGMTCLPWGQSLYLLTPITAASFADGPTPI